MNGQSDGYNCVNRDGCRIPGGCGFGGCKDKFPLVIYNEPEYVKRIEDKLERVEQLLIRLSDKHKEGE